MAVAHQTKESLELTLLDAAMALILGWVAGTLVRWIGRPAANVGSPDILLLRVILEICVALVASVSMGANGLLSIALLVFVPRTVLALSYRAWGGIRPSSVWWARGLASAGGLLIALLPESFR